MGFRPGDTYSVQVIPFLAFGHADIRRLKRGLIVGAQSVPNLDPVRCGKTALNSAIERKPAPQWPLHFPDDASSQRAKTRAQVDA